MLITNTNQESYDSRYKREETTYDNLPETRLIVLVDTSNTWAHGSPSPYERTMTS